MSSDVELIGDSPTDGDWYEESQTISNDNIIERLKCERNEAFERQAEAEKKLADEISRAAEMETRLSASKHQIAQLEKKIILDQNVNRQKLQSLQTSLNDICERVKISDQSVYKAKINHSLNEERLKTLEDMLKIKDRALLAAETALVAAQNKLSYNNQNSYQSDQVSLIKRLVKRVEFCKAQVKNLVDQFVQDKSERKWALEYVEAENRINELEAALRQESWLRIQTNAKISELNQQLLDVKSEFSRREGILLNNEKMAQDRYENHIKMCCKQEEQFTEEIYKLKAKVEFTENKANIYEKQLKEARNELENMAADTLNVDDPLLPSSKRKRESTIADGIVETIHSIADNMEKSLKCELSNVALSIEKLQHEKLVKGLHDEIRKGFEQIKIQPLSDSIDSMPQETIKKLILRCQVAEEKALEMENSQNIPPEVVKKLILRCQAAEEKLAQLTKELDSRNGKTNGSNNGIRSNCLCSHVKSNGKFGIGWSIAKHAKVMESLAILKAKLSKFEGEKSDTVPNDIAESLYKLAENLYCGGEKSQPLLV